MIAGGPAAGAGGQRGRLLAVGGGILGVTLVTAIAAPLIAPFGPLDLDVANMLQGPSSVHWAGTDEYGRDVLTRTIFSSQVSLRVAFVATGIGLVGGTIVGVTAAYLGRWVDMVLMRFMELLFAFPPILLAIALLASLGNSVENATIAIGIVFVPVFARVSRAATQVVLRERYIDAARAIGMGHFRMMTREILPNIGGPLLAAAALAAASAMLIESALSFLGLATQIPDASLGSLLNVARGFIPDAPWMMLAPAAAIFITVLGFVLLADGIRDLIDAPLGEGL